MKARGLLAVLVGILLTSTIAQAASFTALGYLDPTGSSSKSLGISDDGSVVTGTSESIPGPVLKGFRWTLATGLTSIGGLYANAQFVQAWAISGDGTTIVGDADMSGDGVNPDGNFVAFRKVGTGAMQELGDFTAPIFNSSAKAVSYDGTVVVGVGSNPTGGAVAFRWTIAGGLVSLGDIGAPLVTASSALGVSADGNVVTGFASPTSAADTQEAYIWSAATGTMTGIGYLAGATGSRYSAGNAISADGTRIVGESSNASGGIEAFLWSGGTMTGLGALQTGFDSFATTMSDNGLVVGGSAVTPLGTEGFIWDASNGMRDLNTVLSGLGVNLGVYRITDVLALSFDGNIVAGMAEDDMGNPIAFVADLTTVPEPATMGLLAAGASWLLLRRRNARV